MLVVMVGEEGVKVVEVGVPYNDWIRIFNAFLIN